MTNHGKIPLCEMSAALVRISLHSGLVQAVAKTILGYGKL
jgi:hypothetical protein